MVRYQKADSNWLNVNVAQKSGFGMLLRFRQSPQCFQKQIYFRRLFYFGWVFSIIYMVKRRAALTETNILYCFSRVLYDDIACVFFDTQLVIKVHIFSWYSHVQIQSLFMNMTKLIMQFLKWLAKVFIPAEFLHLLSRYNHKVLCERPTQSGVQLWSGKKIHDSNKYFFTNEKNSNVLQFYL